MNRSPSLKRSKLLASLTLAMALICSVSIAAFSQGARETPDMRSNAANQDGLEGTTDTWKAYLDAHPEARAVADTSFGGLIPYGEHGKTNKRVVAGQNPGVTWPELVPGYPVYGSDHVKARMTMMNDMIQSENPLIGKYPLTANFAASAAAASAVIEADVEQSPEMAIPRAKEEQNQANQTSADSNAQMERNQAGAALDFVAHYLYNFTTEANNKWNRVRNELFLPMALLLLLPGVVLAQLKATVAAGTPVISDVTSPFDGILRSIVGIFLIPATYLFINYGIDVSNSITYTIKTEYHRIFGTDMYEDAMCAHIRAFPFRNPSENFHHVPNIKARMGPLGPGAQGPNEAFRRFEGQNLEVALRDPCAKLDDVPKDRANETVPYVVNAQRNSYNTVNSALAMTWNILCAFQQAYLYYLWFVGPVIAALWVYPMKELRDAFPAWINGVVTICFWSLFWNTTILLMACCRGVDETGTLIMSALNFLTTASVKFAFDFSGLVKEAGAQAAKMAEKGGAAGAGGGGGASGAQGAQGAAGQNAAGQPQVPSYVNSGRDAGLAPAPSSGDRTVSGADFRNFDSSALVDDPSKAGDPSNIGLRNAGGDFNVGSAWTGTGLPPMESVGAGGGDLMAASLAAGGGVGTAPFFGFSVNGAGGLQASEGAAGGPLAGDSNGDGKVDAEDIKASFGIDPSSIDAGSVPGGIWSTSNMATTDAGGVTLGDTHHNSGGDTHHQNHAFNINQEQLKSLFQDSPQASAARDQMREQLHQQMLAAAQNGGALGVMLPGGQDGQGRLITAGQFDAALAANNSGVSGMTVGGNALMAGGDAASFQADLAKASASVGSVTADLGSIGPLPFVGASGTGTNSLYAAAFNPTGIADQIIPLTNGNGGSGFIPNGNGIPPLTGMGDGMLMRNSLDSGATNNGFSGPPSSVADVLAQGGNVSNMSELQRQALDMANAVGGVPNIPAAGQFDVGALNVPSLASLSLANTSGVSNLAGMSPEQIQAMQNQQRDMQLQGGAGNNTLMGSGGPDTLLRDSSGQGGGQPPTFASMLNTELHNQWQGPNGYEANLMKQTGLEATAGIRDANMQQAKEALENKLTGQVTSMAADTQNLTGGGVNTGGGSGFVAAPANYQTADSGGSGNFLARGSGDANAALGNVAQPDPLMKEQMGQLAKALDYTPEVPAAMARSGVDSSGLQGGSGYSTLVGSGGTDNLTNSTYAAPSAMDARTGASGYTNTGDGSGALPTNMASGGGGTGTGSGGFVANGPDSGTGAGGGTFDKTAYLSNAVQDQWKQYDSKVEQAVANEYKASINGAVENTNSLAKNSISDNMTGTPTALSSGGSQPTYLADSGSSGSPTPAANYQEVAYNQPSYAQPASYQPSADTAGGGGNSGGGDYGQFARDSVGSGGLSPQHEIQRDQMDQLARSVDSTPEIKIGQSGSDAQPVQQQGLQYYAQQGYQANSPTYSMTDPQQLQLQQQQQQLQMQQQQAQQQLQQGLPTNAGLQGGLPLPIPVRYGNVANNRNDALSKANRNLAKDAASGGDKKNVGANKLSSALGRAASTAKNSGQAKSDAAAAGPKAMKDPLGSVSTGSTLRRLRKKLKWSAGEIEAMKKLAGVDPTKESDWEL